MQKIHVRFGDLPECGVSTNWDTEEPEAGVSVYAAEYDAEDARLTVILHGDTSGAEIGMLFDDRPIYVVTGDVLTEKGSDGEPLIANATASLLDIDPGTIGYVNP